MTNAKHTPGPWGIRAHTNNPDLTVVYDARPGSHPAVLALVYNKEDSAVIERAPAMADLLRLVEETLPDHDVDCQVNGYLRCNCEFGPMHDKIRDALARIDG